MWLHNGPAVESAPVPELRQLRAFVAVAEELNFTRAAERLFVTQQGVSRLVAQLEGELGVLLLDRTTHDVTLTPAGAALLGSGRDLLAAADGAWEGARSVGRALAGTVRIGVTPAVGTKVRAEAVRALRDEAPELSVDFHEVRPAEIRAVLRDRVVDAVLARTSPGAPEIDSAPLRPTPASLFVAPGHRLADGRTVRLAELDGESLLTWNLPGTPYTDMLVGRLAAAGARITPMQARVTGGGEPPELADRHAVALLPEGWPAGDAALEVPLEERVELPMLLLWPSGAPGEVVRRLRRSLGSGD